MRRKVGSLIPIEVSILNVALELRAKGTPEFHGFSLAKELKEQEGSKLLTAYGTLYRALDRLRKAGLLKSEWEDPAIAEMEGRPRRRLYRITASGQAALAQAAETTAENGGHGNTKPVTP